MSLDPQRVAEARDWLLRSLADLESAAVLLDSMPSHPDTALFHAQQAAEKAWKAFLFWHDVPFRRTHDLRELGRACVRLDNSVAGIAEQAEDLTQFAWVFRYPGTLQVPTSEEARAALAVAHAVHAAVLDRLPDASHP